MIRFTAVALAALFATSAFASDGPPYAGSYDDVSYGDIAHASFGVELIRPDGVSVAGSQYDDVQYSPPAERAAAPKQERVAQGTTCGCHAT